MLRWIRGYRIHVNLVQQRVRVAKRKVGNHHPAHTFTLLVVPFGEHER